MSDDINPNALEEVDMYSGVCIGGPRNKMRAVSTTPFYKIVMLGGRVKGVIDMRVDIVESHEHVYTYFDIAGGIFVHEDLTVPEALERVVREWAGR